MDTVPFDHLMCNVSLVLDVAGVSLALPRAAYCEY
jgi:hypothetical protein